MSIGSGSCTACSTYKTHIKCAVRGTAGSLKLGGGDVKCKLRKPLKCPFVHTRDILYTTRLASLQAFSRKAEVYITVSIIDFVILGAITKSVCTSRCTVIFIMLSYGSSSPKLFPQL